MTASHSVVIEKQLAHPAEKVWRALTEGQLLSQWLMPNDFKAEVGHRFSFRVPAVGNWSGVTDCEVLEVDPPRRLAYSWGSAGYDASTALQSVVTWTLTPSGGGVLLRMEQSGFPSPEGPNYKGAIYGWNRFVSQLETLLASGA